MLQFTWSKLNTSKGRVIVPYFLLLVIIAATLLISVKFVYLLYTINKKKKEQQIVTPSERIQLRIWSIVFTCTIVGVLVGVSSALISYI